MTTLRSTLRLHPLACTLLVAFTLLATLSGLAPAQGAAKSTTAGTSTQVEVHTWAQPVTHAEPAHTMPSLDGMLFSHTSLAAALTLFAVGAVVMAARAQAARSIGGTR